MDDDMESGNLGPYKDRSRTFPNMRSKPYTPLKTDYSCGTLFLSTFLSFTAYCNANCKAKNHVKSRETFLFSAMRLVVVLSDVKAWKCIVDDNLHDTKIAMKDLIDFMGSKKSTLYNYYLYHLHAAIDETIVDGTDSGDIKDNGDGNGNITYM
ncbi:hypothetical protein RHSIM_Rhsim03G0095100 [Rhododendron simsii]|uniref:Uncharacterized protein n=1 Tax=Rhododendron simsii TaxID=118357 RepID=A0A834H651_RHOSS|nr:hypothetical protein RHSIM_Rhsim03G0095100 [Rhododendron simsii]